MKLYIYSKIDVNLCCSAHVFVNKLLVLFNLMKFCTEQLSLIFQ